MRRFSQVERLRIYLVGSAVFLLLVIAAFVGTARYMRHLRVRLPASLGVNVVRETDGYTYTQTVQGKTEFTIHAAKAVEHTDGKIALHDVSVILYGRAGDRHDRIYGDEFEYDKDGQVVRATGVVHMDLQAAAAAGAGTKTLHVTTSGLVYLAKLGVAATGEAIEFETGRFTGHATGADYSSDSGMLMLHSAVSMSGMAGLRSVILTAATADIDNRNQKAFLTNAKYTSAGRTLEAAQATLHTRPDGTLARVEAQGDVTAVADGATTVSQRGDFVLNATNQLQSALLTGGVTYALDTPLQQRRGKAEQAAIGFDAKGDANHALFTGAVHMTERARATTAEKEPWSQRDLTAAKVETALALVGVGRSQVRDVDATGRARLTMVDAGSLKSPGDKGTTELSADDLKAHMLDGGDQRQTPRLDTVAGVGNTLLRQVGADGMEQTSAGDTLDAKFRPGAFVKQVGRGKAVAGSGAAQPMGVQPSKLLVSAVQQGHVAVMRRVPAKSAKGKEDVQHANAQRAAYDGDLDRMTLTGSVELRDAGSTLWAAQVALDHKTGDVRADGGVKAEFAQDEADGGGAGQSGTSQGGMVKNGAAPAEPTHILADRAEMAHATKVATFYGAPVRLWQDGSQVLAPVIEFAQDQKRLVARGTTPGAKSAASSLQVHTSLVSEPGGQAGATGRVGGPIAGCPAKAAAGGAGAGSSSEHAPQAMRIASGGLTYSGLSREADFTGGVWAEGDGGTIRAGEAEVFLEQPAAGQGSAKAGSGGAAADAGALSGSLSGRIERMVASGAVAIDEPGLHATGARLVYTASQQVFVLTGEKGAPPKAVDSRGRSTTGAALRLHSCDASGGERIEALGAVPDEAEGGPAQRVRTESVVDDQKKTAKTRP
jgi:lipopolysaccharide export system protein LptA